MVKIRSGDKGSKEKKKVEKSKVLKHKNKKVVAALILVVIFTLLIFTIVKITTSPPNHSLNMIEKTKYYVSYSIYANNEFYKSGNISFFEGEFSRVLGLASNKVDSYFNNAHIGDEFNISINASEAYSEYKPELRKVVPRTIRQDRVIEVNYGGEISKDQFMQLFGQEPIINETYASQYLPFPIKVINVNNNVKFVFDVKIGDKTEPDPFGFWLEVVKIDKVNGKMKLKRGGNSAQLPSEYGLMNISFDENYVYFTLTPEIGKTIKWANESGNVTSFNETSIVLDDNHPLAGKDIIIKVKVLNITKESYVATGSCINIPNAPNFDVFIMSYCPYGLQFLKGLLPVWKEFKDKANINVRFVSYTLHGHKEVEENNRMVCIREEQCDKYLPYLECFVANGNADACIEQVGIDKAKVKDCVQNRAQNYLDYDAKLNEQYGVRGSPTVVINGKKIDIWPRSPANIAKTLCQYFSSPPSECSLSFSEENPSPGFGYAASSNNQQQASCG